MKETSAQAKRITEALERQDWDIRDKNIRAARTAAALEQKERAQEAQTARLLQQLETAKADRGHWSTVLPPQGIPGTSASTAASGILTGATKDATTAPAGGSKTGDAAETLLNTRTLPDQDGGQHVSIPVPIVAENTSGATIPPPAEITPLTPTPLMVAPTIPIPVHTPESTVSGGRNSGIVGELITLQDTPDKQGNQLLAHTPVAQGGGG